MKSTDPLPNGVIDSATLFFQFIREKSAMDPFLVDDAIKYLEGAYKQAMEAIGANPSLRRNRAAFFTGAYLGSKISWTRYIIHLKQRIFEAQQAGELKKEAP